MMKKLGKILVIDDDEDVLTAARLFLKQHAVLVHTERDPNRIPQLMRNEDYDVILLDMNFTQDVASGREGFEWLEKILRIDPQAVVVMFTAYGDIDTAVRTIKEGATDFVLKPWQNEKLLATVSSAASLRSSRKESEGLRRRQKELTTQSNQPFFEIVGDSPAMQRIFSTIGKVAATDANVLILGENGTGKELIARAIHRASLRSEEIFVNVDLGSLSETLFESELFGHTKGAFTDAREERAGRFEIANEGTIFLDEIGNLSLPLQAKLLHVLQNRVVTRLGSNIPREVDFRLICATNMPLYEMVRQREFRQDLLYRINTVEIQLPPLRERPEDIPLLAGHFLQSYAKKYRKSLVSIHPTAMKKLEKYHWPGNIRELQHVIERAVIMSEDRVLQPSDFFLLTPETRDEKISLRDYNLEELEKAAIRKAIGKHAGNISLAAKELGLTRASLYRRLEKYGL